LIDLAQQITQHESELNTLRQEYEARQTRLAHLARRRFPTRSRNIPGLVETKVNDMARKGIFGRVAGQPGVVLGQPEKGKATTPRKPAAKVKSNGRKGTAKPKPTQGRREVLTVILKKSRQPQGSGQLARQILATGYQTASKDFATVVSVALNKLPNLERVPGQGYRLKKC
jgi:hypothetical protein